MSTGAEVPLTLSALRRAYEEGLSPTRIVEQVYSRIEEVADPGIFLCLFAKETLVAEAEVLGVNQTGFIGEV